MTLKALTRWDPVHDILSLQEGMNHILGDALPGFLGAEPSTAWFPPVDIHEDENRVVLRAEVPGVSKDDIDIRVEGGIITLRGEKKQEKEVGSQKAYRFERFYGSFARSFVLPTSIDADSIVATYKDGVLEVVLPKSEAAKPKKIQVLAN